MDKREEYDRAREQHDKLQDWLDRVELLGVVFDNSGMDGEIEIVIKTKGMGMVRTNVPGGEAVGTHDLRPLRETLKRLASEELERKRQAAIAEAERTLEELKAKPRIEITCDAERRFTDIHRATVA